MNAVFDRQTDVQRAHRHAFAAPLGAVTSGRLEIAPGASRIAVIGEPSLPELCRIQFVGEAPEVQAEAGVVRLRYRRHSILSWVKELLEADETAASIALNGMIPWRIEISDGASRLHADLSALRLAGIRIGGEVRWQSPDFASATDRYEIQIAGGASDVAVAMVA